MTNSTSGEIDLNQLKLNYRNELLRYIDSCAEPKAVYWEQSLMTPVSLIIGHSILKAHGVSNSFVLDGNTNSYSPPECKSVIFILTPKVHVVDWARSFLLRDSKFSTSKQYHIIAVPTFSYVCKSFLTENGVLKRFTSISEFPLTILPIDSDVLSLEDPSCFADYTIAHRQQKIYQFAQGLMRFQSVFGIFPRMRAKGDKALEVVRTLNHMLKNVRSDNSSADEDAKRCAPMTEIDSQTDMLVVIDRGVDPLTPLLAQLTYEGLISTKWGINYGVCQRTDVAGEGGKSRVPLNSSDEVFAELRDLSFDSVGPLLSRRTKEVAKVIAESKSAQQLTDLRRVVTQLPQIRTLQAGLEIHTSIAQSLQAFVNDDNFMLSFNTQQDLLNGYETDKAHPHIENCILQGAPLNEVLRLICIQSFCNGGLKQRLLEYYKREILQVYGYEHMFTLDNLDRVGLLYDAVCHSDQRNPLSQANVPSQPQPQAGSLAVRRVITTASRLFSTGSLKRNFKLSVQPSPPGTILGETTDTDSLMGRIYVGYIPISVRLVQFLSIDRPVRPVTSVSAGQLTQTTGRASPLSRLPAMPNAAVNAMVTTSRRLVSGMLAREELAPQSQSPSRQPQEAVGEAGGGRVSQTSTSFSGHTGSGYLASLLPGAECETVQRSAGCTEAPVTGDASEGQKRPQVVAVAFVGGVTHAEVSALRTLAAASDANIEFVFITTGFLNADSYLSSLSQRIEPANLVPS